MIRGVALGRMRLGVTGGEDHFSQGGEGQGWDREGIVYTGLDVAGRREGNTVN